MRYIFLNILLTWLSCAPAEGFNAGWISHPSPDATSMIWFRQTYIYERKPLYAHISLTTTGHTRLYVNGINVDTGLYSPYRTPCDTTAITTTYDISNYMRRDSNTIAVLYAPSAYRASHRQLSLTYWGTSREGIAFAHNADDSWLCRKAPSRLNNALGEHTDNSNPCHRWNTHAIDLALWIHPRRNTTCNPLPVKTQHAPTTTLKAANILRHNYFDATGDTICYDFSPGFYGYIRLTLRGAKTGERISINNSQYVCNGLPDEQSTILFTPVFARKAVVCGDSLFNASQIERIEAVNLVPSAGGYFR